MKLFLLLFSCCLVGCLTPRTFPKSLEPVKYHQEILLSLRIPLTIEEVEQLLPEKQLHVIRQYSDKEYKVNLNTNQETNQLLLQLSQHLLVKKVN